MNNVYILHGCCDKAEFEDFTIPSGSNFHWIPWLQKQLLVRGFNCQTPEMPTPYKPSYAKWASIFSSYPLDQNTILVGHSCGCGFFLRFLSETTHTLKKLILVAPWTDPDHKMGDFLNFEFAPDLEERIGDIHLFYSQDERVSGVKNTVDYIRQHYPNTHYHHFNDHGHFCLDEMKTDAFPELLEVIYES